MIEDLQPLSPEHVAFIRLKAADGGLNIAAHCDVKMRSHAPGATFRGHAATTYS